MPIASLKTTCLRHLASYLAARQGRDDEALAVKLNRVVASGQVPKTAFITSCEGSFGHLTTRDNAVQFDRKRLIVPTLPRGEVRGQMSKAGCLQAGDGHVRSGRDGRECGLTARA